MPQNNVPTLPPTSNYIPGLSLRPPPLPGQQVCRHVHFVVMCKIVYSNSI